MPESVSLMHMSQAIARSHRYGQKKQVLVFKLMVKDTVEGASDLPFLSLQEHLTISSYHDLDPGWCRVVRSGAE